MVSLNLVLNYSGMGMFFHSYIIFPPKFPAYKFVQILLCIFTVWMLAACKPSSEAKLISSTTVVAQSVSPPLVKKSDWEDALKATYEQSMVKTNKDGVTNFWACFDKVEDIKNCAVFAIGNRDAFRYQTTFTPVMSSMAEISSSKYLHSYVSVLDCQRPLVVLSPHFFSKAGWLFMSKVAIMADGQLLLEHQFASADVQRDSHTWGVTEKFLWVATEDDIVSLEKISNASKVIIRFTGSKGYVTITDEDVEKIKKDLRVVLSIFSITKSALVDKYPIDCK